MANKERGEVDLVISTKDPEGKAVTKTYAFRLRTNEFVRLEQMLGVKGPAMITLLARSMGFREMRAVLRAGLSASEPDLTDDQAGDLLDSIGFTRVAELINEALSLALPEGKGTPGKGPSLASHSPGSAS